MSADNGIYIAKFPDGYRVCEEQAIDNVTYYPIGSKERKEELRKYFGDSKVFRTKEEAILFAHKLEDDILSSDFPILEYGVSYIGKFESFL